MVMKTGSPDQFPSRNIPFSPSQFSGGCMNPADGEILA
jgi:hypothetical protein